MMSPPLSAAVGVDLPPLSSALDAERGSAVRFVCSRFIEFPRLSAVVRGYNTADYSGDNSAPDPLRRSSSSITNLIVKARLHGGKNDGENKRRSRRDMRLSIRGLGKSVRLLTLNTRDIFPWEHRDLFVRALELFARRSRHILGGYVAVGELTKRGYCHAHLAIPDRSDTPSGHYTGYTIAELNELREIWRDCCFKYAPGSWNPAKGVGRKIANIHITASRPALGVSVYMTKAIASYMSKEEADDRVVFFSHRYRSSRGNVRVLPWHPCFSLAAPRADFRAGKCEYYSISHGSDPFCAAVYDPFGPAPPD